MHVTAEISFKSKGIDRVSWTVSHGFYSSTDASDSLSVKDWAPFELFCSGGLWETLELSSLPYSLSQQKQNKTHTQPVTLASSLRRPHMGMDETCAPYSFVKCETALWVNCNLFFCVFYWRMSTGLWGRGSQYVLLSLGHRWPRHICGSVKVRKLLSCQSTKIDEIWEVLGKGWRGTKGQQPIKPLWDVSRLLHTEFSVRHLPSYLIICL